MRNSRERASLLPLDSIGVHMYTHRIFFIFLMNTAKISLFQNKEVRRHFDPETELWYFSIVDVVAILSESINPQNYWKVLKNRLRAEGSEVVTKCNQLKMTAADGKRYRTDCFSTEDLLRLIQSIPSKNAEPFKVWLAKVGYERMQEISDPEKSLNRARENWQKHGRSDKWIQQRMMGQETRNKLTDYWKEHQVKPGDEYAILTNIIHQEWTDLTVNNHKQLKNLERSHNLRDHMNEAELIFTALAELSTRQIAESMQADGFERNKLPAKRGGQIAKDARKALETKTGKSVVTGDNFLQSGAQGKRRKRLS